MILKLFCFLLSLLGSFLRLMTLKIITSWTGNEKIIPKPFLSNISRSKDNQTIKFGQLIEYNRRNFFLKKNMQKIWGRNYSHTLFSKIKFEHTWGSTVWNFVQFVVNAFPSQRLPKHIETTVQTTCFHCLKLF